MGGRRSGLFEVVVPHRNRLLRLARGIRTLGEAILRARLLEATRGSHGPGVHVYDVGAKRLISLDEAESVEQAAPWKSGTMVRVRAEDESAPQVQRVLVVDDNQDLADIMVELVRLRGADARAAHDGLAALNVAREFRPHVVLLDLGLPDLDGYEVARRLRTELVSVRIVAVSGSPLDAESEAFDGYLLKPTTDDAVERVLREHVSRARVG